MGASVAGNGKVEMSYEQIVDGEHAETPWQCHFKAAVLEVAERARAVLPESHGRIDRAVALVLDSAVTLLDGGKKACVTSQTHPGKSYVVNGDCECVDFHQAPAGQCKHRLAYGIQKRAQAIADDNMQAGQDPFAPDTLPAHNGIPARFITVLHGKQFVQYAGLLMMAHEHGLVSIAAKFISVTDALALAEATATLRDGRSVTEAADATPQNVRSTVKLHFPRMALTRAKARALRDLLNISMCSVEELEG